MAQNILRLDAVMRATGLGRSSIYNKVAEEIFPKPIKLGPRAVGWLENEIEAWQNACIETRDTGAAR
ncbi:AlpA family transcriptional regulator [Pararhizobium sp. LjRoot235]|uniref:helix-turn-helix transcriptional regulator n=1 Tax=Pararhizobium sp. LjRoot235 TaxID=3342291 RepID=UPI003ECF81F5